MGALVFVCPATGLGVEAEPQAAQIRLIQQCIIPPVLGVRGQTMDAWRRSERTEIFWGVVVSLALTSASMLAVFAFGL